MVEKTTESVVDCDTDLDFVTVTVRDCEKGTADKLSEWVLVPDALCVFERALALSEVECETERDRAACELLCDTENVDELDPVGDGELNNV